MNRYRIVLVALAVVVLAAAAVFGHSAAAAVASLVLSLATAAYIFIVYRKVRAQRKAREKVEILRRVAILENQRRHMGPVASSVDLSLREFGGSPIAERGMPLDTP